MIRIGFGTENSLKGRLIRWATKSQWSHTWIEYAARPWGSYWATHAGPKGVISVPVGQVYEAYPKRRFYKCLEENIDVGFSWAERRVSAGYDYGVIWNSLLLVLFRITGWKWLYKIVARNAAKYSCSEFVGGFLKAAGILGSKHDPELLTPGDLEKICKTSWHFERM